jgi:hypothetical protein
MLEESIKQENLREEYLTGGIICAIRLTGMRSNASAPKIHEK